jgi:2',3'-cyclic-nucleotide 2'-phosphodiesterase (5'-nucleotidase family)
LEDDSIVADLLEKYDEELSGAYEVLGNNSAYRNSNFLCNLVAELYLEAGIEKWGSEYNIVLGGGSINARKPYNIPAGPVTYADIQPIFPFDNEIVLCAISGQTLKNRFFNN